MLPESAAFCGNSGAEHASDYVGGDGASSKFERRVKPPECENMFTMALVERLSAVAKHSNVALAMDKAFRM